MGLCWPSLARVFQGDQIVKKIWTVCRSLLMQCDLADAQCAKQESKHRYKQVDNIDHFMKFLSYRRNANGGSVVRESRAHIFPDVHVRPYRSVR